MRKVSTCRVLGPNIGLMEPPVILVTAFSDEKFQVRAMRAGAVGFLSKPFDESSLISCLESALSPSIELSNSRSGEFA